MSTRRPEHRTTLVAGACLACATAAVFGSRVLWPAPARSVTPAVPVQKASVIRTDVNARQVVAGTLGFEGSYTVVNELGDGVLTWLPGAGQVIGRGRTLFRLAGQAVTLLFGGVPAWRDFGPGMTSGPDVRELQRNLDLLGFGAGPADGSFGWSTEAAIARWQRASGLEVTGTIPLGQVVFLPGPLRVSATPVPLGSPAAAGTTVLGGTSSTPGINAVLTVGGPAVGAGDAVLVTLPDGSSTITGRVASVGRVATVTSGGGLTTATVPVTISIGRTTLPGGLDQAPVQISITGQSHSGVLAVPVTALLALPGGGYAVRAAPPSHRLIPVTTGLFDDAAGLVEVSGPGLTPGLTVEVAQG